MVFNPDAALVHTAALIGGYLLGSIPFGLLLTILAGKGDIRKFGSGNIGATNVARGGGTFLGAATLLLDGGKGVLAVVLAAPFGPETALAAGLGAVLGHDFSLFLKFKGGKGVATTFGVFLGVAWPLGVMAMLTWLFVALLFRYSSLSALLAFALSPLFAYMLDGSTLAIFTAGLGLLGILRHHWNIKRLIRGEEEKFGR